jgi:hypothetical protein
MRQEMIALLTMAFGPTLELQLEGKAAIPAFEPATDSGIPLRDSRRVHIVLFRHTVPPLQKVS